MLFHHLFLMIFKANEWMEQISISVLFLEMHEQKLPGNEACINMLSSLLSTFSWMFPCCVNKILIPFGCTTNIKLLWLIFNMCSSIWKTRLLMHSVLLLIWLSIWLWWSCCQCSKVKQRLAFRRSLFHNSGSEPSVWVIQTDKGLKIMWIQDECGFFHLFKEVIWNVCLCTYYWASVHVSIFANHYADSTYFRILPISPRRKSKYKHIIDHFMYFT